jgi:DNA-binding NtrC family response regulator
MTMNGAGRATASASPVGGAGSELLGVSPAMARVRAELAAIARGGFRAVLVQGESGVGKEVVTEALRRSSPRAHAAYEVFDCPAVPEDHLESELFGTTRGAFPGALDKRGALERAHGGIVFFDEIAAMRRDHQAKILRAIEGKTFRRVGGSASIAVDVATIAAAHEDLAVLAGTGGFRHDLYYRLIRDGVLVIPPLRERLEDVEVLVRHYAAAQAAAEVHVEPAALAHLRAYDWPGNVRQLHTVVRVALRVEPHVLAAEVVARVLGGFASAPARPIAAGREAPAAGVADRPPGLRGAMPVPSLRGTEGVAESSGAGRWPGFHAITATTQRRALLEAYEAAAGNKTAAGVLLGFHLSPGEEHVPGRPLTESRRNLALRKFRYWSGRLGIADSLVRRPSHAALADLCAVPCEATALPQPSSVSDEP